MSARQNQSGSLGLKARLITLSSLGNRRAAAQILVFTLGWTTHCNSPCGRNSCSPPGADHPVNLTMIYNVLLVNAKLAILPSELFIILAVEACIEET